MTDASARLPAARATLPETFQPLAAIGLTCERWQHWCQDPALAAALAVCCEPSHAPGDTPAARPSAGPADARGTTRPLRLYRLTGLQRDRLQLHDGAAVHDGWAPPRWTHRLAAPEDGLAVGDWVSAAPGGDGLLHVAERFPPTTRLVRRDADGLRHVLVSNVDTAAVVMGLDADYNLRRLERYVALLQGRGVDGIVVLTKADRATPAAIDAAIDGVQRRLAPGTPVLAVDGTSTQAARALQPWLGAGRTLVLLGSSGAGKSTLTNTLAGGLVQDTGAVRESDGRGQHTTTTRVLHRLPQGACVIDTPGLRALRPDADAQTVAAAFDDVTTLARACRFRNCRHAGEPGCAVQASLDPDRLRNFHKLLREARRDEATPLERRAEVAMWKARGRLGSQRARAKRGGLGDGDRDG